MALRGKWIADLLSQVGRLTVSLDYANEKVAVCNGEVWQDSSMQPLSGGDVRTACFMVASVEWR